MGILPGDSRVNVVDIATIPERGKSGQGEYNDVMVAHDELVGQMLDQLEWQVRLGQAYEEEDEEEPELGSLGVERFA